MPLSKYLLVPHEGSSEKVRAALSRFSNIDVEPTPEAEETPFPIWLSTESKAAELAWESLLQDLRGVESCERIQADPKANYDGVLV